MSLFTVGRFCGVVRALSSGWRIPQRGLKRELKIDWIRPVVPGCTDFGADSSGDLVPHKPPDFDDIALEYRDAPSLERADEQVKRLFSIGFQGKTAIKDYLAQEFIDKVKRHKYDAHSYEVQIARMTGKIRYFQERLKEKKDVILKGQCKELIERRKAKLKLLRNSDYRRFEWLLEQLDLVYKPQPEDYMEKVTRKKSLMKLTELQCEEIKAKKMKNYRSRLIAEKEKLLRYYAENPI